jgi:outer membrane lipoprotein-sorting protein
MTSLLALTALTLLAPADPTESDIVQRKLEDATFVARVAKGNQAELAKITKDFGNSYRVKSVKSFLKEPLKMRLETSVEDSQVTYIINDFVRYFKVPRIRINSKEDLKNSPGKMQTVMDYGVLTPSLFQQLFSAKYIRTDRASGDYVFDLTYKKPRFDDTSRHRVWIDPQKRVMSKREWYNQHGRQLATFLYEDPINRDGVWFPSRGVVKNMDGQVAGVIEYDSVKVNTGLAESLFKP